MEKARIQVLEQWVQGELQPDRTWLFDVPLSVARRRLDRGPALDRFEKENETFFQRTRDAYLERAVAQPERFRIVDSARSIEAIRAEIRVQLDELVAEFARCTRP